MCRESAHALLDCKLNFVVKRCTLKRCTLRWRYKNTSCFCLLATAELMHGCTQLQVYLLFSMCVGWSWESILRTMSSWSQNSRLLSESSPTMTSPNSNSTSLRSRKKWVHSCSLKIHRAQEMRPAQAWVQILGTIFSLICYRATQKTSSVLLGWLWECTLRTTCSWRRHTHFPWEVTQAASASEAC